MRRVAVILVTCLCFLPSVRSQNLERIVFATDSLLDAQQYSLVKREIKSWIDINIPEIKEDDIVLWERLANNLREAQIKTGDFLSVYEVFSYGGMEFHSEREYIRMFHLNSLWLRSAPVRSYYGADVCDNTNLQCAVSAYEMFKQYGNSIPDRDRLQRTVWDDLLIAYGTAMDFNSLEKVLDEMRPTVESIPYSSPEWPSVYWFYRALLERNNRPKGPSQALLKQILYHALSYKSDFALYPWLIYSMTEAIEGSIEEAHQISDYTFNAFGEKDYEQLISMTRQERYSIGMTVSLLRNYAFLPHLPEGVFEDVLYNAVLISKNRLLDLDTKHTVTYGFKEVRNKLGENDVAVEFVRTGRAFSEYGALLLRNDWERPVFVNIGNEKDLSFLKPNAGTHRDNAAKAGEVLFGPISKHLRPGDHIYYSPEGIIAGLNLDALILADGSLAGETYNIHRVSSTQHIRHNDSSRYDNLFLYADSYSLKYATEEIDRIKGLYHNSGHCHLYNNWQVPESLPHNSIIHIATHNITKELDLEKYPILTPIEEAYKTSGLIFKDKENDQIIWGEKIAAHNLNNTDLVVLSACHSAAGKSSLDGVLGLQRAFKQAGAKTLLLSLWKVDDKASMVFMEAFYKALFSGKSKYDSFKIAQSYVRDNYSSDPYYWAPFVLLD